MRQQLKRNKVKEIELDQIAKSALKNYEGDFTSVKFFTKATSTIYKVTNAKAEEFALKIYDDASSNVEDNLIEALILKAIQSKGTIPIAAIIPNKKGQDFTLLHDEESNTSYRIVLSKWLEGDVLKGQENEAYFYQLGQLIAELHLVTQDLIIPPHLTPKKWDQVFYFRDEKAVYHEEQYSPLVSSEFKALMDKAIPLFDPKLKAFYTNQKPQLLHGDINPWNVKVHKGQLSLLDFEDVTLGYPIHDLAILLFYYKDREEFDYELVKKSVLAGYISVNKLPKISEEDLELLAMARTVNLLNWVLTLEEDHQEFIAKSLVRLKRYLSDS